MLSPQIQQFAEAMQAELDANAHKGDWQEFRNVSAILVEIAWHQAKLLMALKADDRPKVHEHSADCANYYMMLTHAYPIYGNKGIFSSDCSPSE